MLWRARRAARSARPTLPPTEAMRRAAGLGAAEAGLVNETVPTEVTMTALLADLGRRGYLRIEKADRMDYWLVRPGPSWPEPKPDAPGPPIPLAGYERYLLRKAFGRRREERPVPWLMGDLADEVYGQTRVAAWRSKRKPGVEATVREFYFYLQALNPAELDPETARDYLPYLIGFRLYHQWPRWGVCPPWQQTGEKGARQSSHDGAEREDELARMTDSLYTQIRSAVEQYEIRLEQSGGHAGGGHHGGGHDVGGGHL